MILKYKGLTDNGIYVDGEHVSLVRLLKLGMDYDMLDIVIGAFDDGNSLILVSESIDKESRLLPFMLPALLLGCTLDMAYRLAMIHPDLVHRENRVKGRKRCRQDWGKLD